MQLTIRGLEADLERAVRELSRAEGISLNQAALRLLRRGAGVSSSAARNVIGNALDDFIGTWSDRDQAELDAAVADFERIDDALWE
ncbi:MAG TPA: hypothetical protein VFG83_14130 [Kofleriaceae bacterium]|nr:hypothetical protein [Kofleriaceae bacterium]